MKSLKMIEMKQLLAVFFYIFLVDSSCTFTVKHEAQSSAKDSFLREYLSFMDSANISDTSDFSYQILRAAEMNDTAFFLKQHRNLVIAKSLEINRAVKDSCLHLQSLKDLHVDEAYRFVYDAAFCPYKLFLTITKKDSIVTLHFIRSRHFSDSEGCSVEDKYDKSLTVKNWEDLTQLLEYVDFWRLKQDKGHNGFDGDYIVVSGYKHKSIYDSSVVVTSIGRWLVGNTAIIEPFKMVLKLSGNKKNCSIIP
jgi:hypothetical protein